MTDTTDNNKPKLVSISSAKKDKPEITEAQELIVKLLEELTESTKKGNVDEAVIMYIEDGTYKMAVAGSPHSFHETLYNLHTYLLPYYEEYFISPPTDDYE